MLSGYFQMYEDRHTKPLSPGRFLLRLLRHFAAAAVLVGTSMLVGMWGYERYEHATWRDAFLNAATLLSGMGPVGIPRTNAGKLFVAVYALYAGLVFLAVAGLLLAPVLHRIVHRLHWEATDAKGAADGR